ncbi:MAG TPA: glycoside hydrolase family 99-like domain-containing protein [Caulobacterales bacterium]|nr:glycoside hydrolase family 99-like domain-containing protein [Caulobacterales bacterium]
MAKRPAKSKRAAPRKQAPAVTEAPRVPRRGELVFVSGMHRSGTSALTRTLALCGMDLPRSPVGTRADNPDGFWESAAVVHCNDQILAERRSRWDDVWASHPARIGQFSRDEIAAAKAALEHEFSFTRMAVLKDPRISVLFPLWRAAAAELDLDTRLVIAVRNPLEVTNSLLRRDAFPPLKGALLWLSHVIALERASRGVPRVFVAYDDLLRDWRRSIARIERVLGISMPLRTAAGDLDIDKFLSRDKRHHEHSLADVAARTDLPAWIAKAYDWLHAAAQGASEPSAAPLDVIGREFYAVGDVCAPLMASEVQTAPTTETPPPPPTNEFQLGLYSSTAQSPFSEETCARADVALGESPTWIQLATPDYQGATLTGLRLDPAAHPGAFFLKDLTITDENGIVIWQWDGSDWFFNTGTGVVAIPSLERGGVLLEFLNKDPQIHLSHIEALIGRGRVAVNLLAAAATPLDVERMRLVNAREPDIGRRLASAMADFDERLVEQSNNVGARLDVHDATTRTELNQLRDGVATLAGSFDARLIEQSNNVGARLDAHDAAVRQELEQLRQNIAAVAEQGVQQSAALEGFARALEQNLARAVEAAQSGAAQMAQALNEKLDSFMAREEAQAEGLARRLAALEEATQAALAAQDQSLAASLRAEQEAAGLREQIAQLIARARAQDQEFKDYVESTGRLTGLQNAAAMDGLREDIARALDTQRLDQAAAIERLSVVLSESLEIQHQAVEDLRRGAAEAPERTRAALDDLQATLYEATRVSIERHLLETQALKAAIEARLEGVAGKVDSAAARSDHDQQVAARRMEAIETRIERLNQDLARQAQRDDLHAAMRQIETLQQQIEQLCEEVAVQGERAAVNEDLSERVADLMRQRDHLLNDVAELRKETHGLRNSTSWRITAPIRALKDPRHLLGGAFRRDQRARAPSPPPQRNALAPPPEDKVRGDGEEAPRSAALPAAAVKIAPAPPAPPKEAPPPQPAAFKPRPAAQSASPDYVPITEEPMPVAAPARIIAFYLPQFHPIPENDEWWGEGFTEWTNVLKATPQFVGHYQPRLPDELGFYDLRDPGVQARQAELAKLYGVHGFCFYFYWFAGKRLLERPTEAWLHNKQIDFPYCLCWANENWSRRWDGYDAEVLIAQDHSPDDDLAFIAHIAQYLRDPRYIRIDGRPLLLVYRPGLFPAPKDTAARWRAWCRDNGVGEIYLAYTQSFESVDPAEYGFDAAIEFPPNNSSPRDITDTVQRINPDWSGTAYDYKTFVERSWDYQRRPYPFYRGVYPTWDNEARRIGRGVTFVGSTPALFRDWTRNAVRDAVLNNADPDKRIVFCNAWNEWAEGAYLEPDRRYGYAWLQSARDALIEVAAEVRQSKLVLVVHDGYLHGAQFLALNLAREFHDTLHRQLEIVILGDGPLKPEFARYGRVHDLAGVDPEGAEAQALAQHFFDSGAVSAICNTSVSGLFLGTLARAGLRCVSLVHELPGVLRQYDLTRHVAAIRDHAALTVFPAELVRAAFPDSARCASALLPQGLYKRNPARTAEHRQGARERLRQHFGLAPDAHVVLCVGFGDRRKGIDLFVEIGARVLARDPTAAFVWVGDIEGPLRAEIESLVEQSGAAGQFIFPGFQKDTGDFYAGADVYALTSREDPFPTVVMESLDVGVPVVAFEGAGGFVDLVREHGVVAPAFDTAAFAGRVLDLLGDRNRRQALGEAGIARIARDFSFRRYAFDLAAAADPSFKRVSVVVPNYNYAKHMADRLGSIRNQSTPIYEIVVLDDCSNDDSVPVLTQLLRDMPIDHELIVNERNSGSACRQWLKGVERTRGDIVWIAEADDLCDSNFLKETLAAFDDGEVIMSYCQSQQMSGDGRILCPHYLDYVADIDGDKWRGAHVADGLDEIRSVMGVKNTVPNVSACLFRREALLAAMAENIDEIARYRVAGDWATYVRVLERGKIAFTPNPLNHHRRHERSVTIGSFNAGLLREILSMQRHVREHYGLTPRAAQVARAYAQQLYVQFGLNTEAEPNVAESADFAAYFTTHAAE